MSVIDYTLIAERLRNTARRCDNAGKTSREILEEIITIAEDYESRAEEIEMEMIIQMQRDWVEVA